MYELNEGVDDNNVCVCVCVSMTNEPGGCGAGTVSGSPCCTICTIVTWSPIGGSTCDWRVCDKKHLQFVSPRSSRKRISIKSFSSRSALSIALCCNVPP